MLGYLESLGAKLGTALAVGEALSLGEALGIDDGDQLGLKLGIALGADWLVEALTTTLRMIGEHTESSMVFPAILNVSASHMAILC